MGDLDHVKAVNDRHEQLAGDELGPAFVHRRSYGCPPDDLNRRHRPG